jgi:hypothetical protein
VEFGCRCGFWASRQEGGEAPGFAKLVAGWDFRYCKETLLGLHQVFWRQAEGNKRTDTASGFELLPMLSRVVCDWDNRLHQIKYCSFADPLQGWFAIALTRLEKDYDEARQLGPQ